MTMRLGGVKTLVVGMEKSGLASVVLAAEQGAQVRATDLRPLEELPEAAAPMARAGVRFERQTEAVFEWPDLIVLSPGVPADLPPLEKARRRGAKVIGEIELAAPFLKGPIIGITGANGKTTVTAMTGHILRECGLPAQVGGNIGRPVTGMVADSREEQWNVLELSSFQLETIETFRARIGVALNVTPDHLDRHRTFENYAAAKGRLFETQQAGDYAVLNAEDAVCVGYAAQTRGTPVWFSSARRVERGAWLEGGTVWYDGEALIPAAEIPIRGMHNIENTMAAAATARLAGAAPGEIARAIRTFKAVEHRLEFVRSIGGVAFYNDSKATNVDAALKALAAFDGRLWVILGGKDKGSDYTVLREPLRAKAHAAMLIGAAAEKIASHLGDAVRLVSSGTLERAVAQAYAEAAAGDTVLLAPACASFDQFRSYEHRGRTFKELVGKLASKE
jgi:UDP-N-acetylmuramoylalanine--D-glutamate ligase